MKSPASRMGSNSVQNQRKRTLSFFARQLRFQKAGPLRAGMSEDDLRLERDRLAEEVRTILRAREGHASIPTDRVPIEPDQNDLDLDMHHEDLSAYHDDLDRLAVAVDEDDDPMRLAS